MNIVDIFTYFDYEMLLRLLVAAILGLLMGIERELKRKSLGLKTILVISIVSCLLTIVSIQSAYIFPRTSFLEIRMDPLRLAAQIVSGVGFLGAGVILRRADDTVSGLTTAAIVWGAAGIGIATGAGFYIEAITGVALLLFSIELIPTIVNKLGFKGLHLTELFLKITLENREEIHKVIKEVKNEVYDVKDIKIKDLKNDMHLIALRITVNDSVSAPDFYYKVSEIENIISVEIES